MGIDHDMIVSSLSHAVEVVIVHPLTVVVFATWHDVAHVATLNSRIAIVNHKLVSLVEVTLIVASRT